MSEERRRNIVFSVHNVHLKLVNRYHGRGTEYRGISASKIMGSSLFVSRELGLLFTVLPSSGESKATRFLFNIDDWLPLEQIIGI